MCAAEPPRELIATDADVLMNLMATGRFGAILAALRIAALVAPRVESEALYLEADADDDVPVLIDLAPAVSDGTVIQADLDAEEIALYVELAREVDDGEAQAIALARARELRIATDDRRAGRAAARLDVRVVTTPELMFAWENLARPTPEQIGDSLRAIERRACYRPGRTHPLRSWWESRADEAEP